MNERADGYSGARPLYAIMRCAEKEFAKGVSSWVSDDVILVSLREETRKRWFKEMV